LLRSRLVLEWSLVALFGMLVASSIAYFDLANKLDNLLLDVAASWRSSAPDDQILIVEIDNDSLAAIGNWPWQRSVHAQFLKRLKAYRPRAIAYDVLFLESEPAAGDAALAESIAMGSPTLLPVLYQVPGQNGASESLTLPIAPLLTAAAGVGEVNLLFDSDGLVRRAQLQTNAAGQKLPHLMEQIYRQIEGRPSRAFQRAAGASAVSHDASPLLPLQTVGSFRRLPYSAILNSSVPAAFLRDKIILVGATAEGMGDRYPVSAVAGSTMAGIEIQANLLNALITDRLIQPSARAIVVLFSVLPVLILMLLFWRFRPNANLALSLAFVALILAASVGALVIGGVWLPPAAALIAVVIAYPLWGWRRLQALSGFLAAQSQFLRASSDAPITTLASSHPLDSIGRQAADLEGVISDMSDQRRFIADVIAGLPDAICVLDASGRVSLANPSALALFGPDAVGFFMADLLSKSEAQSVNGGAELRFPDDRSFLLRNVAFGDRPGSITMLAETTALRALGREREEMLEFLSHDMRAPQSAILLLLGGDSKKPMDAATQARIADYARKTLRLADDFVQLARLKAVDLTLEEVDVAAIASEAIDLAWPLAKTREARIIASGLDAEVFIRGDASALLRVLSNLIDNAIKYGPISAEVTCNLTVEQHIGNGQAALTISDNGPGLPPERLKDVFSRFGDRGDTSVPGSGLGLAFVRAVIQQHGGDITCASEAQRGTCFTIRLPLV
jgi:CHASE2 domain-containing sensor protein/signal transduction histidine kinase